jgi:uncharacterized membrane protein YkoI
MILRRRETQVHRRTKVIVASAMLGLAVATGAGVAVAASAGDDGEGSITGPALERASAAALAHTGGGQVTDTEVGDEESYYEVEVTLEDGREVDVQLDEAFNVVGDEADDSEADEADDEADRSITGPALERASAAALAHTGGGKVTDTEVGDEESYYEVEVTLEDGREVDVRLDETFTVVGDDPDELDEPDDSD